MKIKNILFSFLLVMGTFHGVRSQQSMNDYSFVQVPDTFSFLYGADQHQLNSLTKFLFNKHGFNAYFSEELPNVRKCDGLYAEVEGTPGFIYTKITVVVKDCKGNELFRSAEGRSKEKEYKRAYHEALRSAFTSIADLGIQQKDILIDMETSEKEDKISVASKDDDSLESNLEVSNLPTAKFSNYNKQGNSYLLRKTNEGYSLYQEVKAADDDLLLVGRLQISDGMLTYTNVMGTVYSARFTNDLSLVINLPGGEERYDLVRN